jgi:hypothetical protein
MPLLEDLEDLNPLRPSAEGMPGRDPCEDGPRSE